MEPNSDKEKPTADQLAMINISEIITKKAEARLKKELVEVSTFLRDRGKLFAYTKFKVKSLSTDKEDIDSLDRVFQFFMSNELYDSLLPVFIKEETDQWVADFEDIKQRMNALESRPIHGDE